MNYPRNPQRRMNNFNETAQNRQRNGYGQNKPGKYEPGKATLRPNNDKRGPRDPDYKGVVTIEQPGVYFISGWINRYDDGNEAIGLRMNLADADQSQPSQGYGQGRPQQGQGYRQPQQAYRQPQGRNEWQGQDDGRQGPQQRPNGAMSRARPIPAPQYREEGPYDNAPPPNEYPDVHYPHPDEEIPF